MNYQTVKFILLLLILAAGWYLGRIFHFDVSYYQDLLLKYPLALSGAAFVILYVATATFLWFGPKDVLMIGGAVLFGPVASSVLIWAGEMINAPIMFFLSRSLGRDFVQQKFGMKTQELDKIKRDASYWELMTWRSNPLIPYRFMDLGYGLTTISFRKYFLAIVLVTFFRVFWLQYILAGIGMGFFKDISAMLDYFLAHPTVLRASAVYFLVVFLMTIAALAARSFRKKK